MSFLNISLSAAWRLLFVLTQKVTKKVKFAVTHNNKRLSQVGLKLALASPALKQQTDHNNDSVHLRYSDGGLDFVKNIGCFSIVLQLLHNLRVQRRIGSDDRGVGKVAWRAVHRGDECAGFTRDDDACGSIPRFEK